jgi:hypothetical protein
MMTEYNPRTSLKQRLLVDPRTLTRRQWVKLAIGLGIAFLIWSYTFATTSGVVIDAQTKQPIAGAYVMAIYREAGGVWAGHSSTWCVRTEGMYTDKDGKYRFSKGGLLRLNQPLNFVFRGMIAHEPMLAAIKPDYYLGDWDGSDSTRTQLVKQNPSKPEFRYGFFLCDRPASKDVVNANVVFLKIVRGEYVRLGREASSLRNIDETIQGLEPNK